MADINDKDIRIKELEARVSELEAAAAYRNREACEHKFVTRLTWSFSGPIEQPLPPLLTVDRLSSEHIERYSRQMMISQRQQQQQQTALGGTRGQQKLLSSSVLVVGAGGLGSTAILYIAAAGVGRLGICDFDVVEISNLHRQVIHATDRVGWNKAVSACLSVSLLNPTIPCHAYTEPLTADNALTLIQQYDVVVDCSDNPRTRYLLNDAAVLAKKPLVSGSAVGTEGQLTVYWNRDDDDDDDKTNSETTKKGCCYRCMYPRPETMTGQCRACADAGVLGPVPGLIGILQALETLKLLTSSSSSSSSKNSQQQQVMHDKMLLYDAMGTSFWTNKKPPPKPNCAVCSSHQASIRTMADSQSTLDLTTRGPGTEGVVRDDLDPEFQVTCQEYQQIREREQMRQSNTGDGTNHGNGNDGGGDDDDDDEPTHILLDVRVASQFDLCALPNALNIPMAELPHRLDEVVKLVSSSSSSSSPSLLDDGAGGRRRQRRRHRPIYCICRRGVDSIRATKLLLQMTNQEPNLSFQVYNVQGGLNAWRESVDPSFPKY